MINESPKAYVPSLFLLAVAISATLGLRFALLYANVFTLPTLDETQIGYIYLALSIGTSLGYLTSFMLPWLEAGHVPKRSILKVLMTLGYVAGLTGLICLALSLLVFGGGELSGAFVFLLFGTSTSALAVAMLDIFWLHGLLTQNSPLNLLTLASGFGIGALFAFAVSRLPSGIGLFLFACLWAFSFFVARRLGVLDAFQDLELEQSTHSANCPRTSSAYAGKKFFFLRFDYRQKLGLDRQVFRKFLFIALYLCSMAIITGISSRLLGNEYFGDGLRQYNTLLAILLAALILIALQSFMRERPSLSTYFALSSVIMLVALIAIPIIPSSASLLVPFMVFSAFFIALITSRALLVELSVKRNVSLMFCAGFLFALSATVQNLGFFIGALITGDTYQENEFIVLVFCFAILAVALIPFCITRVQELANNADEKRKAKSDESVSKNNDPIVSINQNMLDEIAEQFGCTAREKEILVLLIQGYTRSNIAAKLYISSHTVKSHVQAVYRKFGVADKQELIKHVERKD